jgi:hypothetical protein
VPATGRVGRGSIQAGDGSQLVHRVQGGDSVRLGRGRVVEDGVDQVIEQ